MRGTHPPTGDRSEQASARTRKLQVTQSNNRNGFTGTQLEEELITKRRDLKGAYRTDVRDRAALEKNFREKLHARNHAKLTDAEFQRLLDEVLTPTSSPPPNAVKPLHQRRRQAAQLQACQHQRLLQEHVQDAQMFPSRSRILPMDAHDPLEESHRERSNFVRRVVQRSISSAVPCFESATKPPERIVQFWDDLTRLPDDVRECITTWKKMETRGFERLLFDKHQASEFIRQRLGQRYKDAYDNCYHPAMQSDYFRLCYIFVEGGCYIDTDDVYEEAPIEHLFTDGRLKLQPLCYDMTTNLMVPPSLFTKPGADSSSWIFYFNNNPLIAGRRHPLIDRALAQATLSLEKGVATGLPEIQSTTGPGNLTKSIFDAATENEANGEYILVLCDWEQIATTRWNLSYRNDARNWRLSNCQDYQGAHLGNV